MTPEKRLRPRAFYSAIELVDGRTEGRVLARVEDTGFHGQVPLEVKRHWVPGKVSICWSMEPSAAVRRLSNETKARMRENRIRKRYPLIADQLIEQEAAR